MSNNNKAVFKWFPIYKYNLYIYIEETDEIWVGTGRRWPPPAPKYAPLFSLFFPWNDRLSLFVGGVSIPIIRIVGSVAGRYWPVVIREENWPSVIYPSVLLSPRVMTCCDNVLTLSWLACWLYLINICIPHSTFVKMLDFITSRPPYYFATVSARSQPARDAIRDRPQPQNLPYYSLTEYTIARLRANMSRIEASQ